MGSGALKQSLFLELTDPFDVRARAWVIRLDPPGIHVLGHCASLKSGAARIHDDAKKLSADALALAEKTTLSGTCDYTKLE